MLGVFDKLIDVVVVSPKSVSMWEAESMRLKLKDPRCAPYVAPSRHIGPERREVIQTEVEKLKNNGAVRESTPSWAASCLTVRKKMKRFVQCKAFEA